VARRPRLNDAARLLPLARVRPARDDVAVLALLRATHLAPSLAVTAIASALALASGVGASTALVAGAVLAGQFSVGWGNDWIDRDRDRAVGRRDKPLVTGEAADDVVRRCAVGALAVCVVLSLALGPAAAGVHLAAVGLGWSYDAGLKRTVLSVVPYVVAFGLLPVFVAVVAGGTAPWWAVAAAALLGAGAHFTNTLPDFEADAATGVRALPHRVGRRRSAALGALLIGAGALVAALGQGLSALPPTGAAALVASGGLVLAVLVVGLRATRTAFTLSMAAAGTVVVLLVTAGPVLARAG
jgi:4-hydroxybenzoate polyprenyltransferase